MGLQNMYLVCNSAAINVINGNLDSTVLLEGLDDLHPIKFRQIIQEFQFGVITKGEVYCMQCLKNLQYNFIKYVKHIQF